ncbi:hypothetical protein RJT34_32659 [Clitoria ternatea]|uniref:Uncharacterized protein n=1 Tax=Clitoria ternatea TaxID=43366 RepID=A0AAN9I2I5_CLITE
MALRKKRESEKKDPLFDSHVHIEKSILVSHDESNWDGTHIFNFQLNQTHIIGSPVSLHFHSKVYTFQLF